MSQPRQSASSFGTALRRLRISAGLSVSELAERTHYSKGYLSKVENGIKLPSPEFIRRCDAALGAGGELIRPASSRAEASSALAPGESAGKSAPLLRAGDGIPPAPSS